MKNFNSNPRITKAEKVAFTLIIAWLLFWISSIIGAIWIAWHFVSKFW